MRPLVYITLAVAALAQGPVRVPRAYASLEGVYKEVAGPRWPERAAQGWAESAFNHRAVSPVGAMGVHQFMPRTWAGGQREGWIPQGADPFDPVASIKAGHIYASKLERMARSWLGPCTAEQEWEAGLCGYNAGPGSLKKSIWLAKELGLPAAEWKQTLPRVTGHHSKETLNYIPRIRTLRDFFRGRQ